MKRLQRVPEQQTINSRVKAEASLGGLHATMTADFIAAPFSMVSHITITLDLSPGWHRVWPSLFPCLQGLRVAWQSAILTLTLAGSTAETLYCPEIKECWCTDGSDDGALPFILIHKPEQHRIPPSQTKSSGMSEAAASSVKRGVRLPQIPEGQV